LGSYRHITVTPLAPAIGVEVGGLDLARPLAGEVLAELLEAFHDHLVLFFRDQELTPEGLVAFARHFGPVGRYPFAAPLPDHPEVVAIVKEAHQETNFGGLWHSDTAYLERPPLGSALYAVEVPESGGDTLFANMYLACERLSPGLRRLLAGLRAINRSAKNAGALRLDHLSGGTMRAADSRSEPLVATHPVIRRHPVTGRASLYVNRAHTLAFAEMSAEESAPLLEFLFAQAVREEITCRFRWRPGSLALWDNRCSQHYPLNDYHGERRVMHRVTIEGERPLAAGQAIGDG
jgi:taurine dioxygenase